MAQAGFFMYKRSTQEAIGVFATQSAAQQAALDGEYVIVPIEANRTYTNMIDETLPGATIYVASGFDTRISQNAQDIANLDSQFQTFKSQAQNAVTQLQNDIAGLQTAIGLHDTALIQNQNQLDDHETRITALEP